MPPAIPTSLVGSYPQPDWLIDREKLRGRLPPRVRARDLWRAQNEHYAHDEEIAFGFADAVRDEIRDLFAAGADIVQLDEPWMEARAGAAHAYGIATLERALDGIGLRQARGARCRRAASPRARLRRARRRA
jgi:methionine synthase II (cobalamin-independent)